MKQVKKLFAAALSTCLMMSTLIFPAHVAAENTGAVIANNGDFAVSTTSLQWDCTDGQMAVSQLENTAYGKAIGLTTGDADSHFNWYKTGMTLNVPAEYDLSLATGFAFYAKFPACGADTAIDFQWYINDSAYWHELCQGQPIYYWGKNATEVEESIFSWGDYTLVGHNKSGWEGFVFVPFSSLNAKYDGEDRNIIDAADSFQFRISVARPPEDYPELGNQTFVFDELGFYTDFEGFITAASADRYIHEVNVVCNNGEDAENTTALQWDCTNGQNVVSQVESGTYGKAIALTTGEAGCHWNWYKTALKIAVPEDSDVSATVGFAFYAKLPQVSADTAIDFQWYISDSAYWHEMLPGEKIYYVAKGSTTVEESVFDWGNYTLIGHNKAGWEGFVFVPYQTLNFKYDGNDRNLIDAARNFQLRVSVCSDNDALAGQTFVFDELGLYTTIEGYINAAEADKYHPSAIANDGSDYQGMVNPQWNCTTQFVTGTTDSIYGKAITLTTGDAGCGWNNYKTGIVLPRNDVDLSEMKGFAFYAEVPETNGADAALDMFFWNTDNNCWNEFKGGEPIYYVESGTNEIASTTFNWGDYTLPLHNKSGWSGFVFIPFTSMVRTWGGDAMDPQNMNIYNSFEMRVSVARTDDSLANKTYVFDEIGFYSDELAYVKYVAEAAAQREVVEPVEYVSNDGFDSSTIWSDLYESYSVDSVGDAGLGFGKAFRLYSGGEHANWYWAHFKMQHEDVDISTTQGIAFYAKLPDDLDNCRVQIRFYIDDDHYYNDPMDGKKMIYIPSGSTEAEEQLVAGNYPFNGKKGYEGWFFLPYSAMQHNGATTNAAAVNAAENFQIQICMISGDSADFNRAYYVDQLGFYSNPTDYIAAASAGYGVAGDLNGDGQITAGNLVTVRQAILGNLTITDKLFQVLNINGDDTFDIRDLVRFKKNCVQ